MEGGVGAYTRALALAMAAAGHEVHVFTSRLARPEGAARRWRDLAEPIRLDFGWLHPRARRWRWWDLGQLIDLVKRYDVDLVNIQYQAAAYNMRHPAINVAPWRLRGLVPTVVTFHDLRVPYLFPRAGPVRRWAVTFMARMARGVVVTNAADEADLRGRAATPLANIPIGSNIATAAVTPEAVTACRQALGVPPDGLLLGYFGFLNPSKGADLLLDVLAATGPEVRLVFIGGQTGDSDAGTNRPFLAALEAQIASRDVADRVHWTGFRPDAEISALLRAVDLMVMPYRDGVSLRRGTLMAVLAHGRPLITTEPASITPELVHGENVWLVPAGDGPALVRAVAHLRANPALAARLGDGALALSEAFTWDRIAARVAAFHESLLPGSG